MLRTSSEKSYKEIEKVRFFPRSLRKPSSVPEDLTLRLVKRSLTENLGKPKFLFRKLLQKLFLKKLIPKSGPYDMMLKLRDRERKRERKRQLVNDRTIPLRIVKEKDAINYYSRLIGMK